MSFWGNLGFYFDCDGIQDRNPHISGLCQKSRDFKVNHAMADGIEYLCHYAGSGDAFCTKC